ncbi:hypothetical protein BST81_25385 [Leptolyngbya sp. 'hensonii']|uniref:hypothetical protein n=1 Tax=Leptolyngbya sp. 'hensonii' TaxID=1922337 RepID=UPI00094FAD93|nr:hypothetical protein [Leptolyngbya sp. 'hensonii']OLP15611.1 hypothetical protein BST81_25385 [Leptolyngbya sp. 'hensonii']
MTTFGHLCEDNPFATIFPSGLVPLLFIMPIRPRGKEAPLCYLVNGAELTEEQVQQLAKMMYSTWPECESFQAVVTYIRSGFPLRTAWFRGVSTTDLKQLSLLDGNEYDRGQP